MLSKDARRKNRISKIRRCVDSGKMAGVRSMWKRGYSLDTIAKVMELDDEMIMILDKALRKMA